MPTNDTGPTNDPGSLIRELQEALGASNVLHEPEDLVVYEYDATIERYLDTPSLVPNGPRSCTLDSHWKISP